MSFQSEFVALPLDQLHREAAVMKAEGWRFMQTHAVNGEEGIDLYYSFMKDGLARNYKVEGVTKDQSVPSITDLFLAAFVFENEARELFGVDMRDIAIDFQGAMYAPAVGEPMTIISPEQKAAREKAAKAAAAKAAKEKAAEQGSNAPAGSADASTPAPAHVFVMTPERRARLDAKLADMSPEKKAKVEAALKAREEEAKAAASGAPAAAKDKPAASIPAEKQAAKPADATPAAEAKPVDTVLEEKLAHMDADKAAKVRAALARKGANEAPAEEAAPGGQSGTADAELEAKLSGMSADKAAKVREALARKAARQAAGKGGE